jgi:flagellar basal-body rod modification protein FlgD
MSIASVAAQQNNVIAAANAAAAAAPNQTTGTASGATAGAASGTTALSSLSGNFTDFLKMLMTQLQNQDPTSPMDTNAFTTELVQFSSVEQQINTNTSLTSLIQLTQAGEVMQGSNMTGKQ